MSEFIDYFALIVFLFLLCFGTYLNAIIFFRNNEFSQYEIFVSMSHGTVAIVCLATVFVALQDAGIL